MPANFGKMDKEFIKTAVSQALHKKEYSMQLEEELVPFAEFVCSQNPKTFIEIGYGRGETLDVMTKLLPNTKFVGVTLPFADLGYGEKAVVRLLNFFPLFVVEPLFRKEKVLVRLLGSFPASVVKPALPFLKRKLVGVHLFVKLKRLKQFSNVKLLFANSRRSETVNACRDLVGEADFVFVDGDHSFEGVWSDYKLFFPILKKGGFMAFHDIAGDTTPGVNLAWKRIEKETDVVTRFCAKDAPMGIGVIKK